MAANLQRECDIPDTLSQHKIMFSCNLPTRTVQPQPPSHRIRRLLPASSYHKHPPCSRPGASVWTDYNTPLSYASCPLPIDESNNYCFRHCLTLQTLAHVNSSLSHRPNYKLPLPFASSPRPGSLFCFYPITTPAYQTRPHKLLSHLSRTHPCNLATDPHVTQPLDYAFTRGRC
jgi:hypothetical protein